MRHYIALGERQEKMRLNRHIMIFRKMQFLQNVNLKTYINFLNKIENRKLRVLQFSHKETNKKCF